jgi:hypothetical protein
VSEAEGGEKFSMDSCSDQRERNAATAMEVYYAVCMFGVWIGNQSRFKMNEEENSMYSKVTHANKGSHNNHALAAGDFEI